MTLRTPSIAVRRSAGNSSRYCSTVPALLLAIRPSALATTSSRRTLRACRSGPTGRATFARHPSASRLPAPRPRCRRSCGAPTRDGLAVRPAGSRHSFTPLCATDGVAVDLHALAGIEAIDATARTATVLARARVLADDRRRAARGRARAAQPGRRRHADRERRDRDRHARHRPRPRQPVDRGRRGAHRRPPTARSSPRARTSARASTRPRACRSARSGIVTAITFRCVPAYNLHERVWFEGPDAEPRACSRRAIEATRHYEFWWYPFRDLFEHKALALTNAPPDPLPDRKRERIGHSHRVFPSVRDHRFNEMEYAIPAEHGPGVLRRDPRR